MIFFSSANSLSGQFIVVSVIICKPSCCKDVSKEVVSWFCTYWFIVLWFIVCVTLYYFFLQPTISTDTADNQQRSVALGDLNYNRQQTTPERLPPPPGFIFGNENRIPGIPPAQTDERINSFNQLGYASPYPRVPLAQYAHGNIDNPTWVVFYS